jgi:hypothetical protein
MKFNKSTTTIITVIVIIVIAMITIATIRNDARSKQEALEAWVSSREIVEVVVQPGDTLSGLYYQYAPKGIDMYPWIEDIQELNNMSSCNLFAGDRLLIYIN